MNNGTVKWFNAEKGLDLSKEKTVTMCLFTSQVSLLMDIKL